MTMTRRTALATGPATGSVYPRRARCRTNRCTSARFRLLTGAGGQYGPSMVKVIQVVADDINKAGESPAGKSPSLSPIPRPTPTPGSPAATS